MLHTQYNKLVYVHLHVNSVLILERCLAETNRYIDIHVDKYMFNSNTTHRHYQSLNWLSDDTLQYYISSGLSSSDFPFVENCVCAWQTISQQNHFKYNLVGTVYPIHTYTSYIERLHPAATKLNGKLL